MTAASGANGQFSRHKSHELSDLDKPRVRRNGVVGHRPVAGTRVRGGGDQTLDYPRSGQSD